MAHVSVNLCLHPTALGAAQQLNMHRVVVISSAANGGYCCCRASQALQCWIPMILVPPPPSLRGLCLKPAVTPGVHPHAELFLALVFFLMFPAPYPLRLNPITLPTCRRYKDTLCFACTWQLALSHPDPPFRPHASLSLSLSSKPDFLHLQSFLLHLSGLFPAEPYLSWGVEIVLKPSPCLCQAEWRDCPVPLAGCPSEQDPSITAGFQQCWIPAELVSITALDPFRMTAARPIAPRLVFEKLILTLLTGSATF